MLRDYWSFAPQFMQNLALAGIWKPHCGQFIVACRGAPQFMQKRAVAGFCVPHLGHATVPVGEGAGGCDGGGGGA